MVFLIRNINKFSLNRTDCVLWHHILKASRVLSACTKTKQTMEIYNRNDRKNLNMFYALLDEDCDGRFVHTIHLQLFITRTVFIVRVPQKVSSHFSHL